MKRLLVLHHSHTDIGYTETQQRVTRWHIDFIRQALRIITSTEHGKDDTSGAFKWNCETFWAVERFLDVASEDERRLFLDAVRSERIGVSGNYLNFSELIDRDVLYNVTRRAALFAKTHNLVLDSAMTADVNGFGWGYAQVLLDNGIENLFTCVHTHHGMYPLGATQIPFWWESPGGDHLLVWSGEHYHYGNELGLVPGAVSSYLTKDECDAEMIYHDPWGVAEIRIPRYLKGLGERGYPFNFVPVMVSGLRSDNAPPNSAVVDQINRWNVEHGDVCSIEMTTLSEFFRLLRGEVEEIPVYRGDWPDWWSDGPAGSPAAVRLFREAQRGLRFYRQLCHRYPEIPSKSLDAIETNLALFAEHTYSHAASVSNPWHPLVHSITARKKAYAAEAAEAIGSITDDAIDHLGGSSLEVGLPLHFKLLNPLEHRLTGIADLMVADHEFHELRLGRGATVIDKETGVEQPYDLTHTPRGTAYRVYLSLDAGQERIFEIRSGDAPAEEAVAAPPPSSAGVLVTPFVRIEYKKPDGIVRWLDRATETELLRADRRHAPFSPVYEITPVSGPDQICSVRGKMDLNRKGLDVRRNVGELRQAYDCRINRVTSSVTLEYRCPGFRLILLKFEAYRSEPRVDVSIRLHKESVWEPENLYIPLPFAAGSGTTTLWLDKAGAEVRPRQDQIPGTCADFYSVQNGVALASANYGLAISTPDAHLIQIGDLDVGPRRLSGAPELEADPAHLYSWPMTNYWETNFEATMGGFVEFRYCIRWGTDLQAARAALQACRDMNFGIHAFRIGRKES